MARARGARAPGERHRVPGRGASHRGRALHLGDHLHITAYEDVVRRRIENAHIEDLSDAQAWPPVRDRSPASWRQALDDFEVVHRRLRAALWEFPDRRLDDPVPGRGYPFYLMLNGIIQHALYHAGQIEMLALAQGAVPKGHTAVLAVV